jgi:hypothetical protein
LPWFWYSGRNIDFELYKDSMAKKIIWVGLLVGLLDALAAVINAYFSFGLMPYGVFQYIASGLIGQKAYQSQALPVSLGVIIHFSIAITITFIFYHAYIRFKKASTPKFLMGSMYGLWVWLVMNYIIIPFSLIGTYPENPTQIVIGLLIHIFVIGIPIELLTRRNVKNRREFIK